MIFRSAHIYLLFASLINLLLGGYFRTAEERGARVMQAIASIVLLIVPGLFLVACVVDPGVPELERPWARPAIYLSLAAVALHVLAIRWKPVPGEDRSGIGTGSSA